MTLLMLILVALRGSDAALMNATAFGDLLQLAIDFRLVSPIVSTQEQYIQYRTNGLHEIPECPFVTSLYECEGSEGEITSLTLDLGHLRLDPDKGQWLHNSWNFNGGSLFRKFEVRNFYGRFGFESIFEYLFETSRAIRVIVVHNSTFTLGNDNDASDIDFLFNVNEITLTNVSFPQLQLPSLPTSLPKVCSFVNVMFVCPVPRWVWRCFNGTAVEPPCWAAEQPTPLLPGGVLITFVTKLFNPDMYLKAPFELTLEGAAVSCDPPPLSAVDCAIMREPIYMPPSGTRGSVTVRYPLLGRGVSVTVFDMAVSNLTTLLEVFDWETGQFVVAVNRTAPRDSLSTRSVDLLSIPRVLTNTVRITFEHLFPSDGIYSILLRRALSTVNLTEFVPWRPACPAVVTLNERRSLDETIADSFCVNRVCQFECPDADAARVGNFSFGAPVNAKFVAIEGGSGWPQGDLVMQTSDQTNVYRLNINNVTHVTLPGLVGARRVRLIGTTPTASADTTIVRLPGKFVKRLRQKVLFSDLVATDWRAVGSLAPPFASTNASLAVVNGTTYVYSVANNTVFRASGSGEYIDLRPTLSELFVNLTDVPRGIVRRMVSVSDRFLVVLGANVNEWYDGSRMRNWIARRVTATPIDVLDTVTDRWSYGLLQHGVESSTVDFDVASIDTNRFAVVNRERTVGVEISWQPFPFALVECNTNDNCNACLTNVGNIADCRWCDTGRCIRKTCYRHLRQSLEGVSRRRQLRERHDD